MRRRNFLLAAVSIAWNPASAEVKNPRIGFIHAGSRQENQRLLDAFRENLSALGWTDGSNIAVLDRWAEERTERLPVIVKELIGSGVAVLVTAGTPATIAARHASATTRSSWSASTTPSPSASSIAWGNPAAMPRASL